MRPLLNLLSGKSKSDIIYLNGGLNTCSNQAEIQDNQLQSMLNVSLRKSPMLSTRSNRLSIAWRMVDRTNYGGHIVKKMFCSSSKTLYAIEEYDNTMSALYRYCEENNSIVKHYVGPTEIYGPYSICECKDSANTYIFFSSGLVVHEYIEQGSGGYNPTPDVDFDEFEDDESDDNPLEPLEDEPLEPTDPSYINTTIPAGILAAHKNRLWVGSGNTVKFSNLQDFDNFTIDSEDPVNTAGEIQLTNAKGSIVGLISFDGKLIVLCERSWHIIYGSTPNMNLSDSFYVVDMNDGVGCCSYNGYAICDRNLYWIDSDCSVYRYNGASLIKVSEPYGSDNYAQYGGIKNYTINKDRLGDIYMSGFDTYLYICVTHSIEYQALNDTFLVYDTKNRVWWVEDGAFTSMENWDRDKGDYFVGSNYAGDLLWLNKNDYRIGTDTLFDMSERDFYTVPIQYKFETKTWLLNSVKNKKTLTNVWFQADANAVVYTHDSWAYHSPGEDDVELLPIGVLKRANSHNILAPNRHYPEGTERQRTIVPKMYLQKVNAFTIVVEGKDYAEFHLMEKEWRIR